MRPTSTNVLSVYRDASFSAFSYGMTWYNDAHDIALDIDPDIHKSAGIIAALSPMNQWTNNIRKARQLFAQSGDGTGVGLKNNVAKAIAIYNGADPLDILKGDKVRAFYTSILDPDADNMPVIDRHAFDVAVGKVTNDKIRGTLSRKGEYDRFARAYLKAAHTVGISPAQIQAVTWESWRERKGIK